MGYNSIAKYRASGLCCTKIVYEILCSLCLLLVLKMNLPIFLLLPKEWYLEFNCKKPVSCCSCALLLYCYVLFADNIPGSSRTNLFSSSLLVDLQCIVSLRAHTLLSLFSAAIIIAKCFVYWFWEKGSIAFYSVICRKLDDSSNVASDMSYLQYSDNTSNKNFCSPQYKQFVESQWIPCRSKHLMYFLVWKLQQHNFIS